MKNSLSSSLSSIMADLDGSPADPSSDIRPQHISLFTKKKIKQWARDFHFVFCCFAFLCPSQL